MRKYLRSFDPIVVDSVPKIKHMLLELSHITRSYKDGDSQNTRKVLDNISLSIDSGASVAITGPSGSGKSTLLHIMGTLDKPDSGTVRFRGTDISMLTEPELAGIRNRHLGFVFQLHYLLPQLNLLENILIPVLPLKDRIKYRAAEKRALDLLELVGLKDRIRQRPGQMSVGECQRAALIRALITGPELILADEPTGSLDHKTAIIMGDLLKELNKKFSVAMVLVTHSMELAKHMDTIYHLDDGKLVI